MESDRQIEGEGATPRNIMKSSKMLWSQQRLNDALALLCRGVRDFPKFWMMKGQIEIQKNEHDNAAETFKSGLQKNRKTIPLWLFLSGLEMDRGKVVRARSVLESGRLQNPENVQLWVASIRLENQDGQPKRAECLMARALRKFPLSGEILTEDFRMADSHLKRQKLLNALKKYNDPLLTLEAAKQCWTHEERDACRKWFMETIKTNPDFGDAWGYFYKFECLYGTKHQQNGVLLPCISAEPKHGDEWCKVSKDINHLHLPTEEVLMKVAERSSITA